MYSETEAVNCNLVKINTVDWAWCYDCGQVGTDKKGRFKAYDYNVY